MTIQVKKPVLNFDLLSPEDREALERYRRGEFTQEERDKWAAREAAFNAELREGAGEEAQARAQSRACKCFYNPLTGRWDRSRPCPEHTIIG